jgi:outer membrane receptor protein involved in Fe transport
VKRHFLAFLIFTFTFATDNVLTHVDEMLEEVTVTGRKKVLVGEARSASEGVISQVDIYKRPVQRPGDILEAVPGLIVTQHSGSGKSNQLYLRGFNLDHGTDFATWIDGMPVNMRSHGHGQGYTDINFLMPEIIEEMSFVKGPYHSEIGDFSSAGGVHIQTIDQLDKKSIKIGLGENGFNRILAMGSKKIESEVITGALELQGYDGPWIDITEDVNKVNGFFKFARNNELGKRSITAMIYDNEWNSADQIPSRAISEGIIDDFGSLDKTLGGSTRRMSVSSEYSHDHKTNKVVWRSYIIGYELDLWSNFTYLLDDPVGGDQFKQRDKRTIFGGSYENLWVGNTESFTEHRFGIDFRHDAVDEVGLYRSREREIMGPIREDQVDESSISSFYEMSFDLRSSWRAVLGIRADAFKFKVNSKDYNLTDDDSDFILSPKASIAYAFSDNNEMYFSYGNGFHSNDARGVITFRDPITEEKLSPADPLVKSTGFEWGIKALINEQLNTSLAVWSLELDSELLFVGDAGNTEANRPSKRWGIEFNNLWSINEIWSLEADFAYSNAKFNDDDLENRSVPGSLKNVASGILSAEYPSGFFASFSFRYFGEVPLIEDGSIKSEGSTYANLALGWLMDDWQVQLDILNIFDSNDHDIDYFYASRLAGEPANGYEDIHYHIFEPRQIRFYLSKEF